MELKWISLYNSCNPIPIEKYYFCETCGLHPDLIKFLDNMIKKGCNPPLGYHGTSVPVCVVSFGGGQKIKSWESIKVLSDAKKIIE